MTHRALELGAKAVHSQMLQMSQNFNRLQRAYQDAEQSGQTPVAQQIQERMDVMMSSYLCFKVYLKLILCSTDVGLIDDFIFVTGGFVST